MRHVRHVWCVRHVWYEQGHPQDFIQGGAKKEERYIYIYIYIYIYLYIQSRNMSDSVKTCAFNLKQLLCIQTTNLGSTKN